MRRTVVDRPDGEREAAELVWISRPAEVRPAVSPPQQAYFVVALGVVPKSQPFSRTRHQRTVFRISWSMPDTPALSRTRYLKFRPFTLRLRGRREAVAASTVDGSRLKSCLPQTDWARFSKKKLLCART